MKSTQNRGRRKWTHVQDKIQHERKEEESKLQYQCMLTS